MIEAKKNKNNINNYKINKINNDNNNKCLEKGDFGGCDVIYSGSTAARAGAVVFVGECRCIVVDEGCRGVVVQHVVVERGSCGDVVMWC